MHAVEDFKIGERAMRYSLFAPRLYNYCLSLGFKRARMMPSRAFCSDESQGYPIILLTQHFGVFPFDHGQVGGRVATDRHGPHAHHGEDLVIIQASHVGYDPATGHFGVYQRSRTADRGFGDNCGKLSAVLHWYETQYENACQTIVLDVIAGEPALVIDNDFLNEGRPEGLFLRLESLIADRDQPLKVMSTSKAFRAAPSLVAALGVKAWGEGRAPIGRRLTAEAFSFRRLPVEGPEGHDLLEAALAPMMPTLATSARPALDAARYHTQVEFDRTYRSVRHEAAYRGKNLLLIAGLNIDISPAAGLPFPLTKFVPWAAFAQMADGSTALHEQDALVAALLAQSSENPDQISFDAAIEAAARAPAVALPG
jgi:hypothetical protein